MPLDRREGLGGLLPGLRGGLRAALRGGMAARPPARDERDERDTFSRPYRTPTCGGTIYEITPHGLGCQIAAVPFVPFVPFVPSVPLGT